MNPDRPEGVGYLGSGTSVYVVADTGNDTIRMYDQSKGKVTTLAGTPGVVGTMDGTGPAAQLQLLLVEAEVESHVVPPCTGLRLVDRSGARSVGQTPGSGLGRERSPPGTAAPQIVHPLNSGKCSSRSMRG